MPDFLNGNSINNTKTEVKTVENILDVNNIADAVIKAIMSKMPSGFNNIANNTVNKEFSDFDNTASLEKLANAMTIQGKNESNLEGLGITKETKKDKTQTDNTIDMLSQLGD